MAYFEPLIRMDENVFRAPEKMQPRGSRKPLSDMTNSRKPVAKDKSSMKNISGFKASEKGMAPPKAGRKPLGDLTNSNKPRAQEKSSKKNCVENVSVSVSHTFGLGEGFLHNHDECIKANKQSLTMSMDYFLETIALKRGENLLLIDNNELSLVIFGCFYLRLNLIFDFRFYTNDRASPLSSV